jgi:hypothetical protein
VIEYCKVMPGFQVDGELVLANPPVDWRNVLAPTERIIAEVLFRRGPVMRRSELEEECVTLGMNRSTFYVYLGYSPILERYAPGVYGLRGAQIPAGLVDELMQQVRRSKSRVDYGWTADGKYFCVYRLTNSMIQSGVFTVPSTMRELLDGQYRVVGADGVNFGVVTVADGASWGLGRFFRRRGGEPDDLMRVIFDLAERQAEVVLGDEQLVDSANDSPDTE